MATTSLQRATTFFDPTVGKVGGVLRQAQKFDGEVRLLLESQYLGPNVKTFESVLRRRHTWDVLAELFGIEVEAVNPTKWQNAMFPPGWASNPGKVKGEKRRRAKAHAIRIASKAWPTIQDWQKNGDAADAAVMGAWWIESKILSMEQGQTTLF